MPELERVSLAPLFFTTRRQARLVGAVFVLAAAICWLAAESAGGGSPRAAMERS